MAWGMAKFVGAIAFSLGLILVVICGGELFHLDRINHGRPEPVTVSLLDN